MKRSFCLMFVLCVLFCTGYTRSQKSNVKVEMIDGIEYVHNTETPLHPDKTVSFVEDLSISGEDKDGNIILFNPRLSFVDDNENIYISESKDHVIKVFGSDGKYINTIGAKGSGPGEFQSISYLAVTKDGTLVVMDSIARRTSFFDSSGQFLKSFKWRMGYINFIMIKSSSYIVGERAYSGIIKKGFFYVKEFDFDGKEVRFYGEFEAPEVLIIRQGNATNYAIPPVSHHSILVGDQDRELFYHCLNNKFIIEVYDTSGKLIRKIDRPYEPVPFTKKDAAEYRAIYDRGGTDVITKAIEDMKMPKVKNIVSWMYIDDKCNLWIRTNEKKKEEGKTLTAIDIFDPDGYYYAKVWTEFTSLIFKKGKMYRMDTDQDTGYQTLKRYQVVWE